MQEILHLNSIQNIKYLLILFKIKAPQNILRLSIRAYKWVVLFRKCFAYFTKT